jgi:hypothetical protein
VLIQCSNAVYFNFLRSASFFRAAGQCLLRGRLYAHLFCTLPGTAAARWPACSALLVLCLVSLLPALNVLPIALRVAVLCSLHCADRHAYAGGLGPLRHLRLQDVGAICASCLLLHDHTGMRYQWPRHAVHLLARSCAGLNWLCALGKL